MRCNDIAVGVHVSLGVRVGVRIYCYSGRDILNIIMQKNNKTQKKTTSWDYLGKRRTISRLVGRALHSCSNGDTDGYMRS